MSQSKPIQRKLPPHMQKIVQERTHNIDSEQEKSESRRAALERRRMAIQFDIDQGELALEPENPWTHRIELLTEALADVERELQAARKIQRQPFVSLPPTPITNIRVSEQEPYSVSFNIADQQFSWMERLDWQERGGLLAQPDFVQDEGDVGPLIPTETDEDVASMLRAHLQQSVVALATALRDARLNGQPIPSNLTLVDLARRCPICGGLRDYAGVCNTCAVRKVRERELFQERQHLMQQRSAEAEERHRLGERLPFALKRMADLEREIADLKD